MYNCFHAAEREKEAAMDEDEPAPKGDRTPSSSRSSVRTSSTSALMYYQLSEYCVPQLLALRV